MRLKHWRSFAFCVCVTSLALFTVASARAQAFSSIAIGPTISTTGFGVEASTPLIPNWVNLNTGFTTFSFGHDFNAGHDTIGSASVSFDGTTYAGGLTGSNYHGRAHLGVIPLFLTVYPFGGWFNLQAGVFFNNNRITAQRDYSVSSPGVGSLELGNLSGETHFKLVAPYIGIGFGQPFRGNSRFTFTGSLGVMFEGQPNIRLQPSNSAVMQIPQVAALIRQDQNTLNNDARWAQFYPVLNFGVVYRF